MELPDFSEFMDTLNEDEIVRAIEESVRPQILQVSNLNDPKNITAMVQVMYQNTISAATTISNIYLRAYHQWLQTQL